LSSGIPASGVFSQECGSTLKAQGINYGIPGNHDFFGRNAFGQQVVPRQRRGSEMNLGQHRSQPPVGLFEKRVVDVVTAQAGLDVAHGNLALVRRQRGGKSSRGIALD
jgi:hypothetical protein